MKYGKLKRAAGILLSVTLILGSLAGCGGKENGGGDERGTSAG